MFRGSKTWKCAESERVRMREDGCVRYRERLLIKAVTHSAFQRHFYFRYDNVLTPIPISAALSRLLKATSALKTILSKTARAFREVPF